MRPYELGSQLAIVTTKSQQVVLGFQQARVDNKLTKTDNVTDGKNENTLTKS